MTARELYDAVLIELNKENAPNILLEQFNYLANKSVNQYINKRYNIYDINQQTTDDLRVLKATAMLDVNKTDVYNDLSLASNATYETVLPSDYLHILNCICIYDVKKTYKCYNAGDTWRCAAIRLTSDAYSQVLDNFWSKPSYKKPYYYIHNVNSSNEIPTNPSNKGYYNKETGTDRDFNLITEINGNKILGKVEDSYVSNEYSDGAYLLQTSRYGGSNTNIVIHYNDANDVTVNSRYDCYYKTIDGKIYHSVYADSNDPTKGAVWQENVGSIINITSDAERDRSGNYIISDTDINMFSSIDISGVGKVSTIEKASQVRYGNASQVRLEIRYGTDDSIFELKKVYIDYIKAPQHIRLTQAQIDYTEDKSQVLEFPDYVCQEIINELVHIVMENISDQRLNTHPVVSQSIANPAQTQTPEAAG